ncbi:hypothetical protein [Saccharibacter sp. 17.LH.SD]|uniref:hypothetical protein n=1 Tax=Saccharibacter sp. 17.LH.SD TaxID=2689393 RepID=UPI001928D8FE|nr:hypothetical protein [Saccharibacter sp. 17.LH.SD]
MQILSHARSTKRKRHITTWRAVTTRYEKTASSFLSIVLIAATADHIKTQQGMVDYKARGGPKTQTYLAEIERLANTKIIYGHWPKLPGRIEE